MKLKMTKRTLERFKMAQDMAKDKKLTGAEILKVIREKTGAGLDVSKLYLALRSVREGAKVEVTVVEGDRPPKLNAIKAKAKQAQAAMKKIKEKPLTKAVMIAKNSGDHLLPPGANPFIHPVVQSAQELCGEDYGIIVSGHQFQVLTLEQFNLVMKVAKDAAKA